MGSDRNQNAFVIAAVAAAALIIAVAAYFAHSDDPPSSGLGDATMNAYAKETDSTPTSGAGGPAATDSVDLSDSQLASVKVEPVGDHLFPMEKGAVGSIDFNQEMSVQVFTPYQGRIVELFASVGDEVKKGQTLFKDDKGGPRAMALQIRDQYHGDRLLHLQEYPLTVLDDPGEAPFFCPK